MPSVTFTCEVITPMFLAGADGRTPELRPPSIKGMLRFWWRAIQAEEIGELKKQEAEIFGSSDEDIGRSKLILKMLSSITDANIGQSLWNEIPFIKKTSKKGKEYRVPIQFNGVSFLLYSTFMLNERPYLKPSTEFVLKLETDMEENLNHAIHAFWCFTFIGGLGTRSRRGGGNIFVRSDDNLDSELFKISHIDDKNQLSTFFQNAIKTMFLSKNRKINPPEYPILKDSKIYIFDPFEDWKNSLNHIGLLFSDFRSKNKNRIYETPNFGFPIQHSDKTVIGASMLNEKGEIDFIERSASPLIFKIIKTKEKKYFPIIIWLNSKLIPDEYKISSKTGINGKEPSSAIIKEFLKSLDNRLEVTL